MAKSRRKKPVLFYEALTLAPGVPGFAPPRFKDTAAVPRQRELQWRQWLGDVGALLHDTGHYTRQALRPLFGPTARLIYLLALLGTLSAGTGVAVVTALNTMKQYGPELSNPAILMNEKDVGTTILDRNGVELYQGYGAVDRQDVPLSAIPQNLQEATVATEDPGFYTNSGVSIRGTTRAAYQDLIHSDAGQGGSTITQQLVKNTLLSNEKSFTRKYKEVVLAMEMEQKYSKDQILDMYLNTIYYGQGAYGIQAASETYFHKPAKDLTLDESATLAGLPQSPNQFDPTLDPAAAKDRRDYVLSRMQLKGEITTAQEASASAQPISASPRQVDIKAPHFVFYVLDQLRQQYGQDMVEYGGITVRTTLDYTKQEQAQQIVANQVNNLASHHVTNGGLISIDPHNGDIISMVGSIDYNQPGYGAVNVTLAQLQPGSSFKPIAYAESFIKGYTGATVVQDEPECFPQASGPAYCPEDYDLKWRGPVTLRRALANSLNLPAIHVLQYAGLADTITLAHSLGIQAPSLTGDPNDYGLSLVLGSGTVRPIDMAAVYGAFANGGVTVTPRAILSVTNRFGQDITKKVPNTNHQALDPRIAYMITNILSDDKARQEEFGVNNPLQLSRPAAAKTGTTNDFDDNWTVGYTPDVVTAVWVGNNDHTPMNNVDGITGAAPIWHDYMEMALAGTPVHDFTAPTGIVVAKVCASDGGLANPDDPSAISEVFLAENQQTKHCGWMGASIPAVTQPTTPAPTPPITTDTTTTTAPDPQTPSPGTPQAPGVGSGSGGGSGSGNGGSGGTTPQ
jgi:1A family penicillin-binding protein